MSSLLCSAPHEQTDFYFSPPSAILDGTAKVRIAVAGGRELLRVWKWIDIVDGIHDWVLIR